MLATFILPLTSTAQQDQSPLSNNNLQGPVVETILLPVSVTEDRSIDERSNHVLGLDKNDFTVFINGKQEEIVFFSNVDEPTSICMLFDVGGSMEHRLRVRGPNEIAVRLAAQGRDSNEYFLITFNHRVNIVLDGVSKNEVLTEMSKSPGTPFKGGSAMFDALSLGIQKLTRAAHRKRAILVVTVGGHVSSPKFRKLKEQVGVSGIPIYFLVIPHPFLSVDPEMDDLVRVAGGGVFLGGARPRTGSSRFYVDSDKGVEEDISVIARDIRYQYTLGFKNVGFKNKWNRVKVKVTLPPESFTEQKHIYVHSREKYYAETSSQSQKSTSQP